MIRKNYGLHMYFILKENGVFKDIYLKSIALQLYLIFLRILRRQYICWNCSHPNKEKEMLYFATVIHDFLMSNQNLATFQNFSMSFQWRCQNWQTLVEPRIVWTVVNRRVNKLTHPASLKNFSSFSRLTSWLCASTMHYKSVTNCEVFAK